MVSDEVNKDRNTAQATVKLGTLNDGPEQAATGNGDWREVFRAAFERARQRQKPAAGRQELGRDKSRSLFLLLGTGTALLVLFFGLFSRPSKRASLPGQTPRGQAGLGRKATPGREDNDPTRTVTPMLSADVRSSDPAPDRVTPEEVGRTSRTGSLASSASAKPSAAKTKGPQDYSLGKIDFSDPWVEQSNKVPPPPLVTTSQGSSGADQSANLKKPSLVFVRTIEAKPAMKPGMRDDEEETLPLQAGTRLVGRLQAPVSSAVATPVVAVVEYNYERNGQIVVPAGAKVFGRLAQVSPSGYMAIQFNRVEMPDGSSAKIDGSAMDLNFGPLKGSVSGKKTGTKLLVRSLTGLGTVASYLVGPQASGSAELISANTLLRERLANNVAAAGQEKLNSLAFSQNLVVTLPGNTRFYIIVQKLTSERAATGAGPHNASTNTAGLNGGVPTLEELRQLIQLKGEISDLYSQANRQSGPETPPHE